MDRSVQNQSLGVEQPDFKEAWQMVIGELQAEMSRAQYETWVQPLRPIGFDENLFTVGAYNSYGKAWVEERLGSRITQLLGGLYGQDITFKVVVSNGFYKGPLPVTNNTPVVVKQNSESRNTENSEEIPSAKIPTNAVDPNSRKVMLQRAYGSERAGLIQPERGLFLTNYMFNNWLIELGHSAFVVVLAARSMCYWNPMTGELRNVVETEMGELADKAAVSIRTVKDVLNNEMVKRYFLRYRVRRVMTSNGVRTAGISLQVRMDDPLTPVDQVKSGILEEEEWYLPEFSMEKE
jgi:hypothetical protein